MSRVHNAVRNAVRHTLRDAVGTAALTITSLLALGACSSDRPTGVQPPPANAAVASVEVGAPAAPIQVGRTATLTATPRDAQGRQLSGRTVVWTSSSADIARVDASGTVTALTPGSATITASVESKSASATVTVAPVIVPVASVMIVSPGTTVRPGQTVSLTAVVHDADGNVLTGRTVTWQSATPAVATVNAATGVVTAVGVGTAVITAASEGKTSTVQLAVVSAAAPVARVVVSPSPDTLEAFDQAPLSATLFDANDSTLTGRAVAWSSSNPAVATVDAATGVLTGVDRGTVVVTATSEGKAGTASFVVVIRYRNLATGSQHACDIASGGIVWCWGYNGTEGRIGSLNTGGNAFSSTPVRLNTDLRFADISTYGNTTCGVTRDGKGYCWGSNSAFAFGAGSNVASSPTPVAVAGGHTFKQISVGASHACGITTIGRAYCWGANSTGQLGTGNTTWAQTPVASAVDAATGITLLFSSISAGTEFTCGVTTAGAGYCWGYSGLGNLGDGAPPSMGNTSILKATPIAGGHRFREISATQQLACGVLESGEARCWGRGNGLRLGSDTFDAISVPKAVTGVSSFRSVQAGFSAVCGTDNSFAVWCWGLGSNGQLGQALTNGSGRPVRAGGELRAAEVRPANVAGGSGSYTCAISADRLTTYCWGRNDVGQLGNGATTSSDAVNATPSVVVGQRPL
jgi:alpha-tubulin suppressor-like RCC1 family protein/uncharacterized protein YjdB